MKKTALTLIVVLLVSLRVGVQIVNIAEANPYPPVYYFTDPPVISIHSPKNETYANSVLLNFIVTKPEWWIGTPGFSPEHYQTFDDLVYYVDGRYYAYVSIVDKNLTSPLNYAMRLSNLTDGVHSLTVYAYATGSVWDQYGLCDYHVRVNSSSIVNFTLDTVLPSVSILSLENETYYTTNVTLTFAVNESTLETKYCLDGANVTTAGNATLTGLSYGGHSLTAYAVDYAGNVGVSETVFFTLAEEPGPFLTVLLVGSIFLAAMIGIGLLVYFKKYKHQAS